MLLPISSLKFVYRRKCHPDTLPLIMLGVSWIKKYDIRDSMLRRSERQCNTAMAVSGDKKIVFIRVIYIN